MIKNILCIDVGRGTQDALFYQGETEMENCFSLIVPSRTSIVSNQFLSCIENGKMPFFQGVIMGGFRPWKICREYFENGGIVYSEREAAKTFHDDVAYVASQGIKIVNSQKDINENVCIIKTQDIILESFEATLRAFAIDSPIEGIAVAVQDHGETSPGQSNRMLRFQNFKKVLEGGADLIDFAYWAEDLPRQFTRMKSVADSIGRKIPILLMDTGIAAIMGCLEDPDVKKAERKIILNIGNGHTMGAYLIGEKIAGYFEHHTSSLDREKICKLIKILSTGELTFEYVFQDGGHGAYTSSELKNNTYSDCLVAVTGPRRNILDPSDAHFSAPFGNMMITGSYGLLRAFTIKSGNKR